MVSHVVLQLSKATVMSLAANEGSADSRGRKELHNFIMLLTCREQMLYNLLSSWMLMPLESLC